MAAASLTTAPLAVSTAAHDREWWAAEAARCCTDWEGIVETHFAVLTNLGLLERKPAIMTELDENAWTAPGWREAAVEYHKDRRDRRLVIEIDAKRLARLRRLLADEISPDRAWHELRSNFQKGFS